MSKGLEDRALDILRKSGEEGVLQFELWKSLGLDSRGGSRLVLKLNRRGLLRREPLIYNGRKTFRLYIVEAPKHVVSVKLVKGCPCFTCGDIDRCGLSSILNPSLCEALTKWLDLEASKAGGGLEQVSR